MRDAAQHVAKFNLTQKLRATLGTAAALRKVDQLREAAEPREREKAADEVEQLRDVLLRIARSLRAKK